MVGPRWSLVWDRPHGLDSGTQEPRLPPVSARPPPALTPSLPQGDSGGPLVCDLPDAWVLVGLASWGLDCRHPVYPSVFTSVAHFASWIADTQRRTPPPDRSLTPPPTPLPRQPLRAAGPPGPRAAPRPPRAWLPLLFALGAPRPAPQ